METAFVLKAITSTEKYKLSFQCLIGQREEQSLLGPPSQDPNKDCPHKKGYILRTTIKWCELTLITEPYIWLEKLGDQTIWSLEFDSKVVPDWQ